VPQHLQPVFADAEALDDGLEMWARSAELRTAYLRAEGRSGDAADTEETLLRADAGRTLTMASVVASRR
jgi:hypothetical protein